jgi:hypothetical protein
VSCENDLSDLSRVVGDCKYDDTVALLNNIAKPRARVINPNRDQLKVGPQHPITEHNVAQDRCLMQIGENPDLIEESKNVMIIPTKISIESSCEGI